MRSTLEICVIWLVLVAYWLNILLPLRVLYLAIELVMVVVRWLAELKRALVADFRTTREIADL